MTTTLLRGTRQPRRTAAGGEGALARQRRRLFLPFVLPAVVFYSLVFILPAVASAGISLFSWHGAGDPLKFIGIANYRHIVTDPTFRHSFLNSLQVLFFVGISTFLVSFAFTAFLRELRGQKLIRAILFFPHIVSPIVLAIAWGFILDPTRGALNTTLRQIGLDGLAKVWMGPDLLFKVMMLAMTWSAIGFYTTVLMAGVDRIPLSFYDDSDLAGANLWQKFRYITLPMNWDVVAVCAVLWTITAMQTFEFIYAFTGIGLLPSADHWTASLYVYAVGFSSAGLPEYGLGCAMAMVMLAVIAVLVLLVRRLTRREAIQF